MTTQYERIETLFNAALALPPEQRAAYLDAHASDEEMKRRVEAMLQIDEQTAPALETPAMLDMLRSGLGEAGSWVAASADEEASSLPQRIGRYRIIRRLGAGGMGIVYEAEQDSPKRRVALKVMRPGSFSRQMLRRFEAEAHVLGQLHHSGIAQIYESGVAEWAAGGAGPQPYFAMELIDGRPLKVFVSERKCTLRERLLLVARIADAVQHAHQKGVIHRDLKPDNILVDESGQPKILDFGVARATDRDMMVTTLATDAGQIIGTLAYMSPEQVGGRSESVDARSDVYALGVLLYEMLAGCLPLDVTHESVPGALRMIQEHEPRPLSDVDARLRGDLQTIVSKAMEKDKTRRYQSAMEFAADVRRYLNDEPIIARRASALYQFRKFAKRNKAIVGGTAAVFASVTLGMIVATWFAVDASQQRSEAVEARDDAQEQRDAARELAYRSTIAAASASLAAEDFRAAQSHLDQAPSDLRGWEWRHLRTRLDSASLVIEGLGGPVQEIALVQHEGRRRILAIAAGALSVFDAGSGELLSRTPIGSGTFFRLAASPDGKRLLIEGTSADHDDPQRQIAMYEVVTGGDGEVRQVWRAIGLRGGRDVFSADGSTVAVAIPEDDAVAWLDAASGMELKRQQLEGRSPFYVAQINDSALDQDRAAILYVTTERDQLGTAGVVERDGRIVERARHHLYSKPVFAPDQRLLAWEIWTDGRVFTLDLTTGGLREVPQRAGRERVPLAWAPAVAATSSAAAGGWLAIGDEQEVLIWDLAQWAPYALLPGHEHTVTIGRFSQQGDLLVTGDQGGVVRLWTMPPTKSPWIVNRWEQWWQTRADLSPDHGSIASVGWSFVRLWDLPTGTIQAIYNQGSRYVDRVVFSPDGKRVATAARDRGLRVLGLTPENAGRLLLEIDRVGNRPLAWTADGSALLWLDRSGSVEVFEIDDSAPGAAGFAVVDRLAFDEAPMHLMAVSGSTLVALAWDSASSHEWDRVTGSAALAPASGGPGGEAEAAGIWGPRYHILTYDLASGSARRLINRVSATGPPPRCIAVQAVAGSPANLVAIADVEGGVHLWQLTAAASGARRGGSAGGRGGSSAATTASAARRLWSAVGGAAKIDALAFSRDGSRIAVGRVGGVDLLDASTGALQATLPHEIGRVVALAFTRDDAALVACGEEHPLAIFDAAFAEDGHRLPAHVLEGRSRFRQARLIADPLFQQLITSRRVVERLHEETGLADWQRSAAIAYAERRGDHLAGMASDAVFAVRRAAYEDALIRYQTIQSAAGAAAPRWDSICAMLQFLLGHHDESRAGINRYIEWSDRTAELTRGEWALVALLADAIDDGPAHGGPEGVASEAWARAKETAESSGEPVGDLDRLIWQKARDRFSRE